MPMEFFISNFPHLGKVSCCPIILRLFVVVIFLFQIKIFNSPCARIGRLSRTEEEISRITRFVMEFIVPCQIVCPFFGLCPKSL